MVINKLIASNVSTDTAPFRKRSIIHTWPFFTSTKFFRWWRKRTLMTPNSTVPGKLLQCHWLTAVIDGWECRLIISCDWQLGKSVDWRLEVSFDWQPGVSFDWQLWFTAGSVVWLTAGSVVALTAVSVVWLTAGSVVWLTAECRLFDSCECRLTDSCECRLIDRCELRRMLQESSLYRVQLILGKVRETELHTECAILYAKVRFSHHVVLHNRDRILVHANFLNFRVRPSYTFRKWASGSWRGVAKIRKLACTRIQTQGVNQDWEIYQQCKTVIVFSLYDYFLEHRLK